MKNKLKKLLQPAKLIAALVLINGLTSCCNCNESKTPLAFANTAIASPEDITDLHLAPIEFTTAYSKIEQAISTLSITTNSLYPIAAVIRIQHLLAFKELAAQQIATTTYTNYITAMQIHFAIDQVYPDSIHLLYQPIGLRRGLGANNTYSYSIPNPTATYYEYSTVNGFQAVSNPTVQTKKYREDIRIKRTDTSLPPDFHKADDITGDVTSIIYTFQEMEEVLYENNSITLNIWNYVNDTIVTSKTYTKHSLFLSPGYFSYPAQASLLGSVPFKGNFANHPHLCPPACEEFTFKIK